MVRSGGLRLTQLAAIHIFGLSAMSLGAQQDVPLQANGVAESGLSCRLAREWSSKREPEATGWRQRGCRAIQEARRDERCLQVDFETERACQDVVGQEAAEQAVRRPWLVQPPATIDTKKRQPVLKALRSTEPLLVLLEDRPGQCDGRVNRDFAAKLGVVALFTPRSDRDGYELKCSMTQLSPSLFLTAAHCVASKQSAEIWFSTEETGVSRKRMTCRWPKFDPFVPEDFKNPRKLASATDIAVCRVIGVDSSALTAQIVVDWNELAKIQSGKRITLAGAGPDARGTKGKVVYGPAEFLSMPGNDAELSPMSYTDLVMGRADATDYCFATAHRAGGDSGGAVLDAPTPSAPLRLLGVIARGAFVARAVFFTPFAKRRACEFLKAEGVVPQMTDCQVNAGP